MPPKNHFIHSSNPPFPKSTCKPGPPTFISPLPSPLPTDSVPTPHRRSPPARSPPPRRPPSPADPSPPHLLPAVGPRGPAPLLQSLPPGRRSPARGQRLRLGQLGRPRSRILPAGGRRLRPLAAATPLHLRVWAPRASAPRLRRPASAPGRSAAAASPVHSHHGPAGARSHPHPARGVSALPVGSGAETFPARLTEAA